MSIAGGLHNAFAEARRVGCDCMQVFVKNQRQWRSRPLTDDDIRLWHVAAGQTAITPVVAHDTYLINLASPDDALWKRSIEAFVDELTRCEPLSILYLVTHPGSHVGAGEAYGLRRVARAINEIQRQTRGFRVRVLLETTAGQGTSLGHRFEHLAAILARVREPERVGVCVDTCHVFAAGYDLITPEGYAATMAELDRVVGLSLVRCFHVNDSQRERGSRVDRHEHIGRGRLGRDAFRHLVNDSRFAGRPMILETPKGRDARGRDLDRVNLAALRRLLAPGRRAAGHSGA
ncbi:MAG TPA: deoxyribonuclease IV [Phycisphaerae bacterium]|nr:deoxyribonuclease IV [Phycisphaerae bacterium]